MANVKVFLKLFKATDDKTVEFDVADPKKVEGIKTQMHEKDPDLSFDKSYYTIEKEEEDEGEEIDIRQLEALREKLKDERDSLEVKLMEKKPLVIKLMKSKFAHNDPKLVTYSTKTAGVPDEMIKQASSMEELPDISGLDYSIDKENEFLQKVAAYGKMNKRIEEIDERLDKIASILGAAVKSPFKTMYMLDGVNRAKKKSKKFKDKIKNPEESKDKDTGYSYQAIERKGFRA